MTTLGILQARMTSTRLPGKVLAPVLDEPMIGRQLERLGRVRGLDGLVVATSIDSSDDPLVTYLEGRGTPVVRGSLDDVLGRFIAVMDAFRPDVVVRLTADCPLVSPSVADRVIREFHESGVDYVSNTLQPTYPDGLDVEAVRAEALRWVAENSDDPHEREHVTLGVYRRPEQFRVANVRETRISRTCGGPSTTPTTSPSCARSIHGSTRTKPAFEFQDVLDLVRSEPSLRRTSMDAERNAALKGLDTGAMDG